MLCNYRKDMISACEFRGSLFADLLFLFNRLISSNVYEPDELQHDSHYHNTVCLSLHHHTLSLLLPHSVLLNTVNPAQLFYCTHFLTYVYVASLLLKTTTTYSAFCVFVRTIYTKLGNKTDSDLLLTCDRKCCFFQSRYIPGTWLGTPSHWLFRPNSLP